MKQYRWIVTVDAPSATPDLALPGMPGDVDAPDAPEAEGTASATEDATETHNVTCAFSRLRGRITVSIDGDSFELPAGFLGLSAARREVFRLGDEKAVLSVDRGGRATLTLHGQTVPPQL